MKQKFVIPKVHIAQFNSENILTVSVTPQMTTGEDVVKEKMGDVSNTKTVIWGF